MKKRLLGICIILSLIVNVMAVPASALEDEESSYESSIQIGDCIELGHYLGQPIVWRCVGIDENGPLMLSDKVLCLKSYDAKGNSDTHYVPGTFSTIRKSYGSNCWADSNLREWLNSNEDSVSWSHDKPSVDNVYNGYNAYDNEAGFLTCFTDEELNYVSDTTQKVYTNEAEYIRGLTDGGTSEYWLTSGQHLEDLSLDFSDIYYQYVTDKFFVPNVIQLMQAYNNIGNDYIIAYPTSQAVNTSNFSHPEFSENMPCAYWINHPGTTGYSYEHMNTIGKDGNMSSTQEWNTDHGGAYISTVGVRPAFYLNTDGAYPENPGPDQPETSIGSVSFFSKWDSDTKQAYFDYSILAYSVTDNTEISPDQSIDQLVGKYVLVETNENNPLEILSIKSVDSKIGTVTNVIEGNGNPSVTALQFEDGTYAVVNGLIVSEHIIGKQVLYHLSSEEIVGYTELQEKTGTLQKWDSDSGQLVVDGVTYFTNYMTDESLSTSAGQLIDKRVEILCQEGEFASYIFQIAEAREDYHIQIYASTPNLSTNINSTIDITCSLYRDDKLVKDWVDPAFVIGNDKVISISDYTLKDGSYHFTITGLSEGRSSLTISDSYSGAYITVDISVGKATARAYSYRMDDIPSFVPNVYGESVLTNFYNVNDLYVNNFSYARTSDGGYDVSFNVYNQGYMYGTVDVYDKDGKWIQSEKIDKFSDISSLWDTGEAIVYLIADSFDGRLLSYTSGVLSKETPVSVHIPKDGYLTISNNFAESPGTFLYNTVDYLMLSVNTIVDVSVNGIQISLIADNIVDKAIKDIDFQQEFMDKFNEIALNVSQTSLEFGFGEAAKAITVDAEDLLNSVGLNWKAAAQNVTGISESVFSELMGPVGDVLDGCFAFTKLTSYVVQTNDICYSTNAPSILIHVPASTSNTSTVQGVTVTTGNDIIDSKAVLQVFRISDTDAIEIIDGEIPVEEYQLYNICFVKNEEEVKPNGKVTVKIPIPSGYDKNRCVVYRQESDGSWAILQATVEGNYLVFETDHFSLYAIAQANVGEQPEDPNIPVTNVEIDTQKIEFNDIGETYQLIATVLPIDATNRTVVWTSSNPEIATVDTNGKVTAVKNGVATITATTQDGNYTASCEVRVNSDTSNGGAYHPEAGSTSSSDRYAINKPSDVENGSIKVSDSKAQKGDTVTITITPDEGYALDELAVYDADGDEIDLEDKGDGKFTFEMPKGDVEIEVSFVTIAEEAPKADFADVAADAWYADAVQYVFENGMMSGTSETTFSPNLTTTRGMIVTILYRLEGTPDLSDENLGYPYADVDADAYYADAVYWACQNGIVAGMSAEQFAPNNAITREQMAAILYRYAQFKGYDVSAKADLSVYTDASAVGAYATDAMAWANGAELITGTSATTLSPAGNATRAQVATILMRFCENVAK